MEDDIYKRLEEELKKFSMKIPLYYTMKKKNQNFKFLKFYI